MIEIPSNNSMDAKNALISKVVNHLSSHTTYSSYKASDYVPLEFAKDVCREFSRKGYHAKIVYFCDGRSSYQSFHISKDYLEESRARMVYSEMY